jgi:hypothetical protein
VRIKQLGSTPSSTVPTTVSRAPAAVVVEGSAARLGVVPAVGDVDVDRSTGGSRAEVGVDGATDAGEPAEDWATPAELEPASETGDPVVFETLAAAALVDDVIPALLLPEAHPPSRTRTANANTPPTPGRNDDMSSPHKWRCWVDGSAGSMVAARRPPIPDMGVLSTDHRSSD